jgi:hypothetical protein
MNWNSQQKQELPLWTSCLDLITYSKEETPTAKLMLEKHISIKFKNWRSKKVFSQR